jgi:tetratricopeptide (TPR) repeat protein/predicted Ser/Thr protein kinase
VSFSQSLERTGDDATAPLTSMPTAWAGHQPAAEEVLGRGASLGRYVVIDLLGTGGMGVVYQAYDPELDRRVALKLLRVNAPQIDGTEGERRLLREAQAMAKLSHPNVVPVYDVGTVKGGLFVAMEYVKGSTLREWSRARERSWREVVDVMIKAGRGLHAAHKKGIVHRDFKPTNVLIDDEGRARVMDFGIASVEGAASEPMARRGSAPSTDSEISNTLDDLSLTKDGVVMGTPAYMSPEQWSGKTAGPEADQFSFCVVLFEALYGIKPFTGKDRKELSRAVRKGEMRRPPSSSRVPRWLHRTVAQGLATSADQRHPSMEALVAALSRDPGRKFRYIAVGMGIAAAGAGIIAASQRADQKQAALCANAGETLDEMWNQGRRDQMAAGFQAVDLPYTHDALDRVRAELDVYAHAWKTMRRDACEATQIRHEQSNDLMDLRMACLDDRAWELSSLLDVLTAPDETIVEHARSSVEGLTALDACADTVGLQSQVPLPSDPETADQVEQLARVIDQIRARDSAGDYSGALELAEAAVGTATSVGYGPALAKARYWRGHEYVQVGRFEEAETELAEASWIAEAAGDDDLKAKSQMMLVDVVGVRLARYEDAMKWARHAGATVDRIGGYRGALLYHIGGAHNTKGKYAEARDSLANALALQEAEHGPNHTSVARTLDALGSAVASLDEYDEAEALHERAIGILEDLVGPEHPTVAVSLNNLSIVYYRQKKWDEARGGFERALEIDQAALGPNHPKVATHLGNIGSVYYLEEKYAEARPFYERALKIQREQMGEEHPQVAGAMVNLGILASREQNFDRARTDLQQATAIFEKALGAEHPHVALAQSNLGDVERKAGDLHAAITAYERALAIRQKALGDTLQTATVHYFLGRALNDAGRGKEAVEHLRKALTTRERDLKPDDSDIQDVKDELARAQP